MAAGRAIASTEVGGVSDLMGQRHSGSEWFTIWDHGVTARSGDSEGLAQGLLYLINGSDERQAMGERGRAYVQENHLFSRLVKDIVNLYLELVS